MDHADHQNDPRVHVQKNETVKKQLALFDFDGTITTHDTLLEFIKFSKGKTAFYNGFVRNAPYLVGMKIKLLRNQQVKERILAHFFGGMPLDTFQQYCDDFAEKNDPRSIETRRHGRDRPVEKRRRHHRNCIGIT